jgi:hypothetical protein
VRTEPADGALTFERLSSQPEELVINAGSNTIFGNEEDFDLNIRTKLIPLSGKKNVTINLFEDTGLLEKLNLVRETSVSVDTFVSGNGKKASINYFGRRSDPFINGLFEGDYDDLKVLSLSVGIPDGDFADATFDVNPKGPPRPVQVDVGIEGSDAVTIIGYKSTQNDSGGTDARSRSTVSTKNVRLEGDVKEVTFRVLDDVRSDNNDLPPIVTLEVGPKPTSFLTRLKRGLFRGN